LDAEERRKHHAYRLVGFLPILNGTEKERKKEKFRKAKRWLFQEAMNLLLTPLLHPSLDGHHL